MNIRLGVMIIPVLLGLSACNPQTDQDVIDDDRVGNCNLYGHRDLASLGLPFNGHSGDSDSMKARNSRTGNFEWYPLELSISESMSSLGTGQGSVGSGAPSEACNEVLEILVERYYSYDEDNHFHDLSLDITFPGFDYEDFFAFDEDDLERTQVKNINPGITFELTELELSRTVYDIINEVTIDATNVQCDVGFQVHTQWVRNTNGEFNADIDTDTQAQHSSNDWYRLVHSAEFEGDECTFELTHTFETKDDVQISAKVYGGLDIHYDDDDERDGYRFTIRGLDI